MDHGGEVVRSTTAGSDDLGMPGAVQGSEANIGSVVSYPNIGSGVAYPNIGEFWRQLGPVDVVLVGPQLPDGVVRVHNDDGYYSVLQPRPGARRGVMLVDLLPGGGGAVHNGDYALQLRPGAGHGDVLVGLLPDGAGHGEVFVGLLPSGGGAVHDDYGYYAWQRQTQPGAGRGEVLADQLPGGGGMVYNWDYALQPRPDARSGELLPGPNLGEGYDNRGVVAQHLRRLLPFAGIGASSVAINGLVAGPGSPAAAFHLFVLLLGGLFLVILHVLQGGGVAAFEGYVYYSLQPRPGAGRGLVLVDLLPDGAGHGEAFVGHLQGGGVAAFEGYVYYSLQPRPGAGRGEVLVDLLPVGAGHGEVLVGLLPVSGGTMHNDYGYYEWQTRPGAGHGEVLPNGVGMVFDGSGNFARQTLSAPATMAADGIAGALRGPDLGEGYDNRGVVAQHLRRLLPFAGIGASSVAINGLAAGPGSPAAAFHLFELLLVGLFLVILHVLLG